MFPLLILLQVDPLNRGHRSLVICSAQSCIAESGKFCDAISSQCVEARLARRKMDLSRTSAVFEFDSDDLADAMLRASVPKVTFKQTEPYFWMVESVDLQHMGHCEPYRECEKNLYLTYAMKTQAKEMADSGCSEADIADYLSSRGCIGTLTTHRLKHHIDVVRRDMEDYTVISQPGESEAEALLRLLKEKNCRFIYLYTNAPSDISDPSELTVATSENEEASVREGQSLPARGLNWLSKSCTVMREFFADAWSGVRASSDTVVGPKKVSDREKKNIWEPSKRMIRVKGRRVMLMAILWATQEEIQLLKKYPEVLGHDTKAFVNSTGVPWWYTAAFREDYQTFIAMRGHVANETQPMFNFTMQVALPYIHGEDILQCCAAQIGDAKNEFINTVRSMITRGGLTPHGSLLLCAWHLSDRALHGQFKGTRGLWSDSLYQCFWKWQRAETLMHYNQIYNWFKTTWFQSDVVKLNMPASARDDALSLIESLHMRRQHWARCCNINLVAHDTRVNTFVEVQNHILMDVVHVTKTMGLQRMVSREALVMERKDRRFAHKNFRTLTTAASWSADQADAALNKVCGFMKDVMTPSVGKIFTKQVETAFVCLRNADSKWWLCTKSDCHLREDMTDLQREAVLRNPNVMIFHMILMHGESNDDDEQRQYASLGEEWNTLHDSIPAMKYTRIVTAEEVRPGEFLFMCSCGFDFRYQGTCRHISLLLLHASHGECAGCEIGNIALRNTAAFAACRDAKLIQRSPCDWKGIHCGHVTEECTLNLNLTS